MNGLGVGFVHNIENNLTGVDVELVSITGNIVKGVTIGLVNWTETLYGLQYGFLNKSNEVKGVQYGSII
ncbi:MAG: hypothetical protein N3E50_02405 [Candidatus Goldbacteria bacterium]|nr:hypothetical protein [Candidatus Goldiibacteriota bacterium]